MRAQVLSEPGGSENFALKDLDKPKAGDGQVVVRIKSASVNQIDIKIRGGLPIGPALPAVLGCDMAGIVDSVGAGVTHLKPGDEVYGCVGGVKGQGGTMAEFIAADAALVAAKPASLSFREAAALPLVAITAWDAMEFAQVGAGDHVLVHGGTGGVGHVAIQLAKMRGARVSTTVDSDRSAEIARGLGADDTILFRDEDVESYVDRLTNGAGFDVVFDTVGGDNLAKSFAAAGVNGRVVTTNARTVADLGNMHAKSLSLHAVFMLLPMLRGPGRARHGEILRDLANAVDAGKVRPLLDPQSFGLADLAKAHDHASSGTACGKIVVDIA